MKAMVYQRYGSPDVLHLAEIEKPTLREGEVLVKVHAVSINYGDVSFVSGKPFIVRLMGSGLFKPRNPILGSDIAGCIEAIGKGVTELQTGDEVFGDVSGCGWGGYAEYVAVAEKALVLKPANLSFTEAAAVPQAAVVALQGLRDKGQVQSGQKVLIVGASGGIGTFAVQIAKAFGAEVTGVCSTRNVDMVYSIGADYVIDYTKEDFATKGKHYDLILATAGYRSIYDYERALDPQGIYVMTGGAPQQVFEAMLLGLWLSMRSNKSFGNLMAKPNRQDLIFVKSLIEAGKIRPVIDRTYPLHRVDEALEHYQTGHARGKVVITVT